MLGLRRLFSTTLFVASFLFASTLNVVTAQTAPAPAAAVSKPAEPTIAQKIAASKELLDINTATVNQLKALPGMGDAYVQRIIAARPYTAKNQLTTRGIIPQDEYEKIKEQIIAHRPKP
jgi:competence protein ComEA